MSVEETHALVSVVEEDDGNALMDIRLEVLPRAEPRRGAWIYSVCKSKIFWAATCSGLLWISMAILVFLPIRKHVDTPRGPTIPIIGDWGRQGMPSQRAVALALSMFCEQKEGGCPYIISTGDNFYNNGVSSTADPLWQSSFEDIYDSPSLQGKWFPVLGNHDHHKARWAHQIEYTKVSKRWHFPSRFYSQVLEFNATTVQILFLDTSPFIESYLKPSAMPILRELGTKDQLGWLEEQLQSSHRYNRTIVIGHHPIYSAGSHGDADDLKPQLLPLLIRYNATVYVSGHDHSLQYLKSEEPLRGGSSTFHQFVSGAGSSVHAFASSSHSKSAFYGGGSGFMTVTFEDDRLMVRFYNTDADVIYETEIPGRT